jgi:hypothetical protein|tara:strand:+ start:106 stop:729 length:624 start_codon:yes stop_codon:yes gene_type:complete
MLIGLVGLIGSGKDTVANRLVTNHGFIRDSFAKSLKDAVHSIFGWDRKMLEGDSTISRHWREQPDPFWSKKFGKPVTPRWILQYFGTEVCRGNMLDSIWVDSCMSRYKGLNTVISDTRFQNEIKQINNAGGRIVLVQRGDLPTRQEMQESGAHKSEWDWIGADYDYVIKNDSSLENLNEETAKMLNHLLVNPPKSSQGVESTLVSGN